MPFKFEWYECRGDLPIIEHKITLSLDEVDEFIGMFGLDYKNPMNKLSPNEICRRMDLCRESNIKYKEMTGYDRHIVYTYLCDKWSYETPILKQTRPRRAAQPNNKIK